MGDNKKIKDIAGNFALIMISCILTLSSLEVFVRMFHLVPVVISRIGPFRFVDNTKIVYEFIPRSCVDDSIINHQGFKDADFIKEKAANVVRIAMLGDSITQGMYIPLGKTFSDYLERLLNQRAIEIKSNIKYEVMNFAVGGYNLEAEVETLKTKVLEYFPDIVILNFFYNDNDPLPGVYWVFPYNNKDEEKQKVILFKKYISARNSPWHILKRNIFYKSKLFLFLTYRFTNFKEEGPKMLAFVKQNSNFIVNNKTSNVFYKNLAEIERLRKKYGFKFLICLHSHLSTGEHPNNFKFAEITKSFNFPYFHMFDYYKKEHLSLDSIQVNRENTCHANELGHLIIAKAIFTELKRYGFIDSNM